MAGLHTCIPDKLAFPAGLLLLALSKEDNTAASTLTASDYITWYVPESLKRSAAVSNSSASVDVILQDSASHKLIAKARYTEQAPHRLRARATAYLTNAATAARSAVQRLQTAAEHALQRADGAPAAQSDSDKGSDIRHKAMASLTAAGATVRAAAHRLQLAADSVLRSSSADGDSSDAADGDADDPQVGIHIGFA